MVLAKLSVLALGCVLACAGAAYSDDGHKENDEDKDWVIVPGATSALLQLTSARKWELTGTAGLSWSDGRQAVVTFWRSNGIYLRCFDYFTADMKSAGGLCAAVHRLPTWSL